MKIMALDLGKSKSVGCLYDSESGTHRFTTVRTRRESMIGLLDEPGVARVVMETGASAGWVCDLAAEMGLAVEVANVNHEGWRWRNVKRKTDRADALKLARLSAMDQLPRVHMPSSSVRQKRSLMAYRDKLVGRRTAIKNQIHAILTREGLAWPRGKIGWSAKAMEELKALARPLSGCGPDELWRGQLSEELSALALAGTRVRAVTSKLDELASGDARVLRVRSIPGVGARTGEMIVASIDDPHRFGSKKQVGSYAGLTPRVYQSGSMERQGRISGAGNRLLRKLLVQSAWVAVRYSTWARRLFMEVGGGMQGRRKIAIVAVARRLLIAAWAMLRDGTLWRAPTHRAG